MMNATISLHSTEVFSVIVPLSIFVYPYSIMTVHVFFLLSWNGVVDDELQHANRTIYCQFNGLIKDRNVYANV